MNDIDNNKPEKYILKLNNISKSFYQAEKKINVIENTTFNFVKNKVTSIIGKSGVGKTTLLNLIGVIELPDSGYIEFNEQKINTLKTPKLNLIKNQKIGYIFQFHYLFPQFSALENVLIPKKMYNTITTNEINKAKNLLIEVGLKDRFSHLPSQLSGGEQQRVTIARALINEPELLLSDEPTGDLDIETGEEIKNLLLKINKLFNTSIIVATHDMNLAETADYKLKLHFGGKLENI